MFGEERERKEGKERERETRIRENSDENRNVTPHQHQEGKRRSKVHVYMLELSRRATKLFKKIMLPISSLLYTLNFGTKFCIMLTQRNTYNFTPATSPNLKVRPHLSQHE